MQCIIASIKNFNAYQGFDIFPHPNAPSVESAALPKVHRLLKTMKIGEFNRMTAEELGVDEDLVRPWACVGRQNHTIRPDVPLPWLNYTLEEANAKIGPKLPFRIWVEAVERNSAGEPDWPDAELVSNLKNPAQPILLFLKYFDIDSQTLTGQGSVYIEKSKRISELEPVILNKMGWSSGTNLKLFEVRVFTSHLITIMLMP